MSLRTGRELKKVFTALCPFEPDGKLKPEEERVTVLASNANIPIEIQMKAFAQAAAAGGGSPHIVQISSNCSMTTGNHPKNTVFLEGVSRTKLTRPVAIGKNNINTQYLVDGTNHFADYYEKNKDSIRKGNKKACGRSIYINMVIPQAQRAVNKMKEAGSFGLAPKLMKIL